MSCALPGDAVQLQCVNDRGEAGGRNESVLTNPPADEIVTVDDQPDPVRGDLQPAGDGANGEQIGV